MNDPSIFALDFARPDVAVLTINDPDKGANILSETVLSDFAEHLDDLEKRGDVAGLVIRSAKPGIFIAGADVREFIKAIDATDDEIIGKSRRGQDLFARLAAVPFVTIAAIDGLCLGGGAELAVWCDRRIMAASEKTSLGFPEVKLGIYPGWGGTARTPRIVGLANAVELATGGEPVGPAEAFAMGLVSQVVRDADALLDAALQMVADERASGDYLRDRERWSAPLEISETELGFLGATASAYIQQQTGGHYPAPLAALEVMLGSAGVDVETACKMEAEGFAQLFGSPVNRALLNVFFLQDANKKQTGVQGDATPREIRTATVLGAGVMGQGIASANIKRGIPVALGDMTAEAVGRGVQGVLTEASFDRKTKGPNAEKALRHSALVNGTVSDAELAASDIVVEAIYEDADAKKKLYDRIESQMAPDAILCSNTSTIPISQLAADLKRPENFCGLHFFNPVRRMPLVEVIRGKKSSDATIATAVSYAKRIGKSPIVCNDGPGFIVNRVLLPYMNEALLLLEEGASIKAVDRAATSFGMPMGPITLYDTVGLDVAVHAGGVMQKAFPDRVEPAKILPAMLAAERLGKKNGRGFFDYNHPKKKDRGQPSDATAKIISECRRAEEEPARQEIADRLFLPMLAEAVRILEDGVAASPQDVDLALIYGIGFPPFRGGLFFWADQEGLSQLVLKLEKYSSLGKRYEVPELLKEKAAAGAKFYDR